MIFICEPQCVGFEHAEINAALLAVVQRAFPQEDLHFFAEREHVSQVFSSLDRHDALNRRISLHEIDVPPRNAASIRRFPKELSICKNLFKRARECAVNRVLFASITGAGLAAIKLQLLSFKDVSCVVVLHSLLGSLARRPPIWPPEMLFWLKLWMVARNIDRVRYVVLNPVIEEELVSILPSLQAHTHSIHIPYFYSDRIVPAPLQGEPVRFGAFGIGTTSKKTDCFFKLARDVQRATAANQSEFVVVGYVFDKALDAQDGSVVLPFQAYGSTVDRKMYDAYAQQIHYAVYLYDSATYRLTASAALFDAFYYVKPIIALRHPLFEYYFDQMGDIGFLCESYRELRAVVKRIVEVRPSNHYAMQQQNILRGRQQFGIDALAELFSHIWDPETNVASILETVQS